MYNLIIDAGKDLVDIKMAAIAKDLEEGVEPTGFLSNVIATKKHTPGEIYSSVSELMSAAIDTVNLTLSVYRNNSEICNI